MKNAILGFTTAMLCAGALAAAQSRPTSPGQPTQPVPPTAGAQSEVRLGERGTTNLVGCVYREESIPGRSPNVAERVGILEDYILVVAQDAVPNRAVGTTGRQGDQAPGAGEARENAPQDRPDAGAAATSGSAAGPYSMFKLEHVDDDTLQAMVGKRVEVFGRIDAEADDVTASGQPARDRGIGPDEIELPEFEVAQIREIGGECPAVPRVNQQ